jgi:hypothetical protein
MQQDYEGVEKLNVPGEVNGEHSDPKEKWLHEDKSARIIRYVHRQKALPKIDRVD